MPFGYGSAPREYDYNLQKDGNVPQNIESKRSIGDIFIVCSARGTLAISIGIGVAKSMLYTL